jgi:hypothetical protein
LKVLNLRRVFVENITYDLINASTFKLIPLNCGNYFAALDLAKEKATPGEWLIIRNKNNGNDLRVVFKFKK